MPGEGWYEFAVSVAALSVADLALGVAAGAKEGEVEVEWLIL